MRFIGTDGIFPAESNRGSFIPTKILMLLTTLDAGHILRVKSEQ